MAVIRPVTESDFNAISHVNRQAFGREDESRLVEHLRTGGFARLSLVAIVNDQVVGHILFSELAIETGRAAIPALSLAPLAVLPTFQNRGIGSMLVQDGLRMAVGSGHRIVIVLGEPSFYQRFGFSAESANQLRSPYSGPHLMALELERGALDGVVGDLRYPPPFEMF